MQKSRLSHVLLAVLGSAVAIWFLIPVVFSYASRQLVQTAILHPQYERCSVTLQALVFRDETLVRAPAPGCLGLLVSDGERVSKGTPIAKIKDAGIERIIVSPRAGVVYFNLDGLEEMLSPDRPDALRTIPGVKPLRRSAGDVLCKGDPVARVVDNLDPVVLRVTPESAAVTPERYEPGAMWILCVDRQDYRGRVVASLPGEEATLFLRLERYPDCCLRERFLTCQAVVGELDGLLVPRSAIICRGEQEGIFVVYKGSSQWVPVEILGQLNDKVSIKGAGLSEGINYVVNPRWVKEGAMLR
ncbi:HlyD family efflux transporter periplasmic adaptor subunit [Desulforudis sp. 1088]|uniref:HlyD family efflux transporter periplasmic adaptor subunit n=1 Tax=unclassified Candidatus Desulforudis TaxID=2635950 RepID=UPI00348DF174